MPDTKTSKPTAKFPTFNWIRGVSRDTPITIVHRLILIRILVYRQNNGQCDPGYQTVADELGVDRATVFRAVDVGIKRGWLADFPHGGRTKRNFVFTFPDFQQSQVGDGSTVAPERRSQASTVAEKCANSRRKRSQQSQASLEAANPAGEFATTGQRERAKKNGQKNIYPPSDFASLEKADDTSPKPDRKTGRKHTAKASNGTSLNASEIDFAFAEFWASAPSRKEGKGNKEKTHKLYVALVIEQGVPSTKINAAMKVYAAERAGEDPKFNLYPSTWLENGLYDAEPTGPITIDEQGNVIAESPRQPRPSQPQTIDDAAEIVRAQYPGNRWD